MIKLIVLGSGPIFPYPRTVTNRFGDYLDIKNYEKKFKLHDDLICNLAKKGEKERRTRSSLAIITKQGTVLIDAGPDILYQLERSKVKPDAVFITHDHSDAAYGIKFLTGIKIYRESAGSMKPGVPIEIFGIKITPFRVKHATNVKTCGFRIAVGKKKIAYMSDVANFEGIKKWVSDCDLIFADGSVLDRNMPSHLSIVDQLKIFKKWKVKKVIFTHIGHKTLPHKDLIKYVRSIYQNSDVAFDGLQLIFSKKSII
jgi:phosphoribosyl 1,2-cyclic phosphate phosphodiesterase